MGKKILKIILTVILSVVALLVVIAVAIYIPPVQGFIKDKALAAVSSSGGINITVDGFRMRFPAVLKLENITIVRADGDTMLQSRAAGVRVALLPLVRGKVRAHGLGLGHTYIDLADSAGSFRLRGTADTLSVPFAYLRLKDQNVDVSGLDISRADLSMSLGGSPDDDTAQDTARWEIVLAVATLNDITFRMDGTGGRLDAVVPHGELRNGAVSVPGQTVEVASIRLDSAYYHYSPPPAEPSTAVEASSDGPPWTITAGEVVLNSNTGRYNADGHDFDTPTPVATGRFDAADIAVRDLDLTADSVLSRGSDIRLRLSRLSLVESSGLTVERASGGFAMDSAGIRLSGFSLETAGSSLSAELSAGSGALAGERAVPVSGRLDADISADELMLFTGSAAPLGSLRGRTLSVSGSVSGTIARLAVPGLHAAVPGMADLTLEGTLASVTDPSRISGDVTFRGSTGDLDPLLTMVADTALRRRFDIPAGMNFYGRASFSPGFYAPDVTVRLDSGSLHLKGSLNTSTRRYAANLETVNFPVYRFLPHDSIGPATLTLDAAGSGFDPLRPGTTADIDLDIERLYYNGYPYTGVTLDAHLDASSLSARLHSDNRPLAADLDITGTVADSAYTATLHGRIANADLTALGLSPSPLAVAGIVDGRFAFYPDTAYMAYLSLDTLRINHGDRMETIAHGEITARAGQGGVDLSAGSGDMDLEFTARVPLDSIAGRLSGTAAELKRQIDSRSLDMAALQDALPPFRLEAHAGTNNILHDVLLDAGYGFGQLDVSASTLDNEPLRASVVARSFQTSGITLDTLNLWLRRNDNRLEYALRLRNRPGNIDQMAMVRARGYIEDNKAELNIMQRNRKDSVGFRFGVDAQLLDSALTFTLIPENPTFGYRAWTVNPGNYFTYDFDRELYADMRIEGSGEHVNIISAPMEGFPTGAVRVDMGGIDIGTALDLIPSPPAVGGRLSTDILFGMTGSTFAVDGTVEIDSARWDGRPIGDVRVAADLRSDSTENTLNNVAMSIDGRQVLTGGGSLGRGRTDVRATLTGFPLAALDPFFPEDALAAGGTAGGEIALTARDGQLELDGRLGFTDGSVTVPMVGTSYTLPADYITFQRSVIDFDNYAITGPNGQPLVIDGTVDISDPGDPSADLTLTARNFEAVNSTRSGGSAVYGRALTDIDITAVGKLSALRVRGDISILSATDLTYTLPDNNLEIEDRTQDIVTFISFADTVAVFTADSAALARVWGMDMLVNVEVQDNVQATINLSSDGNNRAELIGDGSLTFSMNSQGDSRFTGRYTLSGGTVVYNPPVISAKTFTVNDGSYVEWTGDIANPTFNVTATESLRTTVTSGDGTSGNVTFNVTVSIRNTLDDLELVFDLAAPGDLTIQNQLQTLSADQRSQQALALLIYNTYTGPGTTATVDVNNPLNSFIEKQINQWARNSLPGVDLSFGVTSVDDSATGGGEHTDYSYKVSKSLFDDRVKVTVGGSINPEASTNDNLRDNFVDDITLEYRLSTRDNMFLKAYRYNTQESILEGEVTETGFGFVARKSMNRLRELFRLRRSPEKKEMNRSRKETRQRVRQAERAAGTDPAREQRQDDPLSLDNSAGEAAPTRRDGQGPVTDENPDQR